MFNSLLVFFFWKASTISSFERFLCWKSKNYSQIFLSRFINYWDNILILYITWGAFSLFCFLSVFSFFPVFLSVFSLTDTNDSKDRKFRERESLFFSFSTSFDSLRFLPLIFTRSICNYQTDSWWDLSS